MSVTRLQASKSSSTSSISDDMTETIDPNKALQYKNIISQDTTESLSPINHLDQLGDVLSKKKLTLSDVADTMKLTIEKLNQVLSLQMELKDKFNNYCATNNAEIAFLKENMSKHAEFNSETVSRLNRIEENMDSIEREKRTHNLVITNLPQQEDLNDMQLVLKISEVIQCKIQKNDINSIVRLTPTKNHTSESANTTTSNTRIRPLVVSFITAITCNEFFHKYLNFKSLNLLDLKLSNVRSRIYINQHLTKPNFDLLMKVKKIKSPKDNTIRRIFCNRGYVFAELLDQNVLRISNEKELNELKHLKNKSTARSLSSNDLQKITSPNDDRSNSNLS